jgi:tRNA1(Val) A37 N6-methylase TrmN6
MAKRVLIEFSKGDNIACDKNTLILEKERGTYSEEAQEILRDFYLKIE